ncbi:hypothetical protein L6164_005877 [Bauhinia variegata]|uniref:Uncharacterized protein n=1 Tax=Bauhinia variegata TaxID=167791 RepID=A0ACB9PVB9_BAUVA|nr:hypothetical protein L6164_005877 [Bauhinia variegata]
MGLFTFAIAGGGFILIGAHEALTASDSDPISGTSTPNPLHPPAPSLKSESQPKKNPFLHSLSFIFVSIFSSLFFFDSLVSLFDASNSHDSVGSALQLQVIAISLLFLLYSILGLLINFTNSVRFPSPLLSFICLFAFAEEFLLFFLQRKDPSGIENRYYDLLLVPIAVCVFSTIFDLKSPNSNTPKLARGIGLILQGTWFFQMGASFFTSWLAHGCYLHHVSRGNYTIRCKDHPEYHRARAIATLQFNCHLALMVVVLVGLFSVISRKNGIVFDSSRYRPLGAEMQSFENSTQFTLDSDDDVDEEIKEENAAVQVVQSRMNGHGPHH